MEFLERVLPDEQSAMTVAALLPGLVVELGAEGVKHVAGLIARSLPDDARPDLYDLLEEVSGPIEEVLTFEAPAESKISKSEPIVTALTRSLEALVSIAEQPGIDEAGWQNLGSSAEAAATAVASLPPNAVADSGYHALRSSIARLLVAVAETELPIAEKAIDCLARGLPLPECTTVLQWAVATGRLSVRAAHQILGDQGVHLVGLRGASPDGAISPRDSLSSIEALFLPTQRVKGQEVNLLVAADAALPRTHELILARFAAI